LLDVEYEILAALGFNIQVAHPHVYMINYINALGLTESIFTQNSWNYLNDSMRTSVCVMYQCPSIACAVILLTARKLGVGLPESWWELFDTFLPDLETIGSLIEAVFEDVIDYSGMPLDVDEMDLYLTHGSIYPPEGTMELNETKEEVVVDAKEEAGVEGGRSLHRVRDRSPRRREDSREKSQRRRSRSPRERRRSRSRDRSRRKRSRSPDRSRRRRSRSRSRRD
jgi:hypothetical protein